MLTFQFSLFNLVAELLNSLTKTFVSSNAAIAVSKAAKVPLSTIWLATSSTSLRLKDISPKCFARLLLPIYVCEAL